MSRLLFGNDRLAMDETDVQRLTAPERRARVAELMAESRDLLSAAIERHIAHEGRMVAAMVVLRLKERTLRTIRAELVNDPRKERVVFLAGRRRDESQRRAHVPISEREGSVVWVSPLVHWTKLDLNTYRWFPLAFDQIRELEALLADRTDIPEVRKTWGWGADPVKRALDRAPSASGRLCSSCDDRFQGALFAEDGAA